MDKISSISIDPKPKFELSPYLYMQFMEPLGTTDGSVEAAWDFKKKRWRIDVIEAAKELSPTMIRWGGSIDRLIEHKNRSMLHQHYHQKQNTIWYRPFVTSID